jgi:hypothetical protein
MKLDPTLECSACLQERAFAAVGSGWEVGASVNVDITNVGTAVGSG